MGSKGGHEYSTTSYWVHLVSEYTGLNFFEVWQMDYILYLTLRRDAFISWLSKSEAGQEYLDNAWRMEQTEPDREALRAQFGRKEVRANGE
jgi:hypothetical protein